MPGLELRTAAFSAPQKETAPWNQDAYYVNDVINYMNKTFGLFAVADGMGRSLKKPGEASQFAIRMVKKKVDPSYVREEGKITPDPHDHIVGDRESQKLFQKIHHELIYPEQSQDEELKRLEFGDQLRPGTTLEILVMDENAFRVAWVGSDRLYGVTEHGLALLTNDHSQAFDGVLKGSKSLDSAKRSGDAADLTRYLGKCPPNRAHILNRNIVDTRRYPTAAFYRFLLMTDGAHSALTEQELAEIVTQVRDPAEAVEQIRALWEAPRGILKCFGDSPSAEIREKYSCRDDATAILIDINGGLPEGKVLPPMHEPYLVSPADFLEEAQLGVPTTRGIKQRTLRIEGEAEVLRGEVKGLREKYTPLEERYPDLEKEVVELRQKNAELQQGNDQLVRTVQELETIYNLMDDLAVRSVAETNQVRGELAKAEAFKRRYSTARKSFVNANNMAIAAEKKQGELETAYAGIDTLLISRADRISTLEGNLHKEFAQDRTEYKNLLSRADKQLHNLGKKLYYTILDIVKFEKRLDPKVGEAPQREGENSQSALHRAEARADRLKRNIQYVYGPDGPIAILRAQAMANSKQIARLEERVRELGQLTPVVESPVQAQKHAIGGAPLRGEVIYTQPLAGVLPNQQVLPPQPPQSVVAPPVEPTILRLPPPIPPPGEPAPVPEQRWEAPPLQKSKYVAYDPVTRVLSVNFDHRYDGTPITGEEFSQDLKGFLKRHPYQKTQYPAMGDQHRREYVGPISTLAEANALLKEKKWDTAIPKLAELAGLHYRAEQQQYELAVRNATPVSESVLRGAYNALGCCYAKLGKYAEAQRFLQTAVTQCGDRIPEALANNLIVATLLSQRKTAMPKAA